MLKLTFPRTFSVRFLSSVLTKINERDHANDICLHFFLYLNFKLEKTNKYKSITFYTLNISKFLTLDVFYPDNTRLEK